MTQTFTGLQSNYHQSLLYFNRINKFNSVTSIISGCIFCRVESSKMKHQHFDISFILSAHVISFYNQANRSFRPRIIHNSSIPTPATSNPSPTRQTKNQPKKKATINSTERRTTCTETHRVQNRAPGINQRQFKRRNRHRNYSRGHSVFPLSISQRVRNSK